MVNDQLTQCGLFLKTGTVVDATLIAEPTSTKNKDKAHDPETHSSQKDNQWHFGMKVHIGADVTFDAMTIMRTADPCWFFLWLQAVSDWLHHK